MIIEIKQTDKTGFTLIELLISAVIFSVIVLSVYFSFQTGIISYNKLDASFELSQTARIVCNKIERDLRNAFVYCGENSKFNSDKQRLDFFTMLDSVNSYPESYPEICRVKYELQDGSLKRFCYKGLDALKEDDKIIDIQADELAGRVQEVSFRYAAVVKNDPDKKCYDWQDIWPQEGKTDDPNQKNNLPLAVEIKLVLNEIKFESSRQAKQMEFIKLVSLPVRDLNAE